MDTNPRRRTRRILLIIVALATALLVGACDTAQQVPWDTYTSQLQQQIDSATATGADDELRGPVGQAARLVTEPLIRPGPWPWPRVRG
jgi:ABC-type uncharacterized transport system auxiliary subunit